MSDLADAVGSSRATVWSRVQRGLLPEPDYATVKEVPYWDDGTAQDIIRDWADDLRGGAR